MRLIFKFFRFLILLYVPYRCFEILRGKQHDDKDNSGNAVPGGNLDDDRWEKKQVWNDWQGKSEILGETPTSVPCVYHKPQIDCQETERDLPRWKTRDQPPCYDRAKA